MPGFKEEEEDSLFDDVNRMADRMGLEGDKRAAYIDDHMIQGGYARVQTRESYARVKVEEEGEEEQGNRWGFGGGRSQGSGSRRTSGGSRGDNGDTF